MTTEETTQQLQFEPGAVKAATKGMTSSDLWKAPRSSLYVDPEFNVREHDDDYKAHIETIAKSIEENGFYPDKPIAGFVARMDGKDVIVVTDGHSRLAGYDLAVSRGLEPFDLPVVTKPRGTSMEDLTIALVTSNGGRPLQPYEVAKVCKRLVGYGMEPKDIAKRLGFTLVYVNGLLDLIAAPKALRDLVSTGKVSATLAIETIKKHGKEAAKVLGAGVKEATASGKERVTKKHVKAATEKTASKKSKAPTSSEKATTLPAAQQELPGLDEAQRLHEGLERASWFTNEYMGEISASEGSVVRRFTTHLMSHLTGLPLSDVEPYFENPASPAPVAEPTETLRQNGEEEETTDPLDQDDEDDEL